MRRALSARIALFFIAVMLSAILVALVACLQTAAKSDPQSQGVLTWHNDNLRTGLNSTETALTLQNVNSTTFGTLFVISTDGLVDAQPLYVPNLTVAGGPHNVLFVATEHDTVYAFDADSGALLWQVATLSAGETPSDDRNCSAEITPEIGITATPVIDLTAGPHGTVYLVAMTEDASDNYHQRLHALDITTGAEQFGGPVEIAAKYPGTGGNSQNGYVTFDPAQYKERVGLLLLNHIVYTAWASHCDDPPYNGWIIGYNQTTLAQQSVLNVTPYGDEGAIWAAGAGLAADSNGNIYFLDANGTFDTTLDQNGFPVNGDYGNAMLKLSTTNGQLAVADYFNMYDTVAESDGDFDLGSGGAMVIPNIKDSSGAVHQLVVGAGKDAHIYLADCDNMGKFNPQNNNQIYQDMSGALSNSVFSAPAFANNTIYYGAVGDHIRAFPFNSNGQLNFTPQSETSPSFGYPGATPSLSGGANNLILWAVENTSPAVLHAYNANNLAVELYNSNQAAGGRDHFGNGKKFTPPMIASGRVYVGTQTGIGVLGLLP